MNVDKILYEKFTGPIRKGYTTCKGFTLPEIYQKMKPELDNLEINENDIWVCTFPKAGTTWCQEMVWNIMHNLDPEKRKQKLDERSPFVEFSMIFDTTDWHPENPEADFPPYIYDSIGHYKKFKSPKLVKTHLPLDLLPQKLLNGAKKVKTIYVARDPRDVCISYYHHSKLLEHYKGNFEEFIELFLAGRVNYGPFWKHVLPFWKIRTSPNILFLKYEDMKKDLPTVIRKVCEFIEYSLTDEQIGMLSEHLKFDSMKKNPAVNRKELSERNKKMKLASESSGTFMRSGKVGDYKEHMTEEMKKRFDLWIEENVANSDYVV